MKKMTIKKIAMLLSALTAFSAVSCVTASASESQSELFPYAMFASSSEEGALTINSRWCNVNGNIASNGTISAGRGNFNGSRTEYAGEEMLYIGESLTEAYFGNAETTDYLDISDTNVFVNHAFDVAESVSLDGNINMNSSVKADFDIEISGNVINANNAVIFSEFGDVVINSNNVNMTGVIYAPLGNVEINASNVNLNNTIIIAETITLNCNNVNANYSVPFAKKIGSASSEARTSYITKYNTRLMDQTIENTLNLFSQYYNLTPVDTGDFSHVNIMNMIEFDIQQYDVEGIGNLSIMKAEGMAQMTTYVLSPYDKDLPLLSVDYMYNGDQRVSYVEYYDLTPDKYSDEYQGILNAFSGLNEKYAVLADANVQSAWYDDLRTVGLFKASDYRADDVTNQMLFDSIQLTLEKAQELEPLEGEAKEEKHALIQKYSDDLVDIGGIATNTFKMAMGVEMTKEFFNTVFFGTSRN